MIVNFENPDARGVFDQFPSFGNFQLRADDDGQMFQGRVPRHEKTTVPDIDNVDLNDKALKTALSWITVKKGRQEIAILRPLPDVINLNRHLPGDKPE